MTRLPDLPAPPRRRFPAAPSTVVPRTWTLALAAACLALPARADPGPASALLAPLRALQASGARVGAAFAVDGKEVAALHGDRLLNPASVAKVFTAAAALEVLGADRTVRTSAWVEGEGASVQAVGITAGGDPLLSASDLATLARCLREAGVTSAGALVADPGPFDPASLPPAFDRKDTLAPYRAGAAPLQVDRGAVTVTVTPGAPGGPVAVALSSSSDRVRVDNRAVTVAKAARGKGRQKAPGGAAKAKDPGKFRLDGAVDDQGRLVLTLQGGFRGTKAHVQSFRVPDPGGHAAGAFREALEAAGIRVEGPVRAGTTPAGARVPCHHDSPPLAQVLLPVLKDSVNPVAEGVLRLLGAAAGARPAGFADGARALGAFLADRAGLPAESFRFTNGSGLYDANRVTARATVALLQWLRASPHRAAFDAGLPASGVDGTMKRRLKGTPLQGRVRAKTGTLDDAVTLAGYVDLPGGRTAAFAVLVNAAECPAGARACPALDRPAARRATDDALKALWSSYE